MSVGHVAYWPFWVAGAVMGAITVGFWIVVRAPLGVSSMVGRFSRLREELAAEREAPPVLSGDELEKAMLAATLAAFGELGEAEAAGTAPDGVAPTPPPNRTRLPAPSIAAQGAFLVALMAGGAAAALLRGAWHARSGMGATFARLFGAGPQAVAILLVGGFLVGAGTTLCGGCSSGHGLSGCSRLQPGSLLAVVCFMASAIATSLLLGWGAMA